MVVIRFKEYVAGLNESMNSFDVLRAERESAMLEIIPDCCPRNVRMWGKVADQLNRLYHLRDGLGKTISGNYMLKFIEDNDMMWATPDEVIKEYVLGPDGDFKQSIFEIGRDVSYHAPLGKIMSGAGCDLSDVKKTLDLCKHQLVSALIADGIAIWGFEVLTKDSLLTAITQGPIRVSSHVFNRMIESNITKWIPASADIIVLSSLHLSQGFYEMGSNRSFLEVLGDICASPFKIKAPQVIVMCEKRIEKIVMQAARELSKIGPVKIVIDP